MKKNLTILLCSFLPLIVYGQLKIVGIYPSDQYYSGWVTLVLSNEDTDPFTGYTSFQITDKIGNPLTKETGPDYLLPYKKSTTSYQLELIDEVQNLPDSLCGTLLIKNPEYSLDFCLNNQINTSTPTGDFCEGFEIVDVVKSGEYWENQVTVLLSTNNPKGTMYTGYTFFQLFDNNGDSLMAKTGPNYFTPVFNTDTFAYNFNILDEVNIALEEIDSMCFVLAMENPVCTVKSCNSVNTQDEFDFSGSIYPNPSKGTIHINFDKKKSTKFQFIT